MRRECKIFTLQRRCVMKRTVLLSRKVATTARKVIKTGGGKHNVMIIASFAKNLLLDGQ